ncbi:MAG: LysR family transcriptional regulator [Spirochaetales bacterium]|nr:LysR family transcriptional regulator [Spirochaetales bacterium]
MLDFRLRTFLILCETKNFSKAGERLGLTQPAVSQQIHQLEERYGTKLFSAVGRQFGLTKAGELLYRHAAFTAAESQRVEEALERQSQQISLRFGATRTIGEFVMPRVLTRYLATHQGDLSLVVDNTDALLSKLTTGQIDFAFIEGIFDQQAFASQTLFEDTLELFCSPNDPLAGKTVELEELLPRRLIVREKGSGSREVLENALASQNRSLSNFASVLEIGNIAIIKALLREGLGLAFLYGNSQERSTGDPVLTLEKIKVRNFDIRHAYSYVHRKGSQFLDAFQEILQAVQAEFH